jgi:hypothetical protein
VIRPLHQNRLDRGHEALPPGNADPSRDEVIIRTEYVLRQVAPAMTVADLAIFDRRVLAASNEHPFRAQMLTSGTRLGTSSRLTIENRHAEFPC